MIFLDDTVTPPDHDDDTDVTMTRMMYCHECAFHCQDDPDGVVMVSSRRQAHLRHVFIRGVITGSAMAWLSTGVITGSDMTSSLGATALLCGAWWYLDVTLAWLVTRWIDLCAWTRRTAQNMTGTRDKRK